MSGDGCMVTGSGSANLGSSSGLYGRLYAMFGMVDGELGGRRCRCRKRLEDGGDVYRKWTMSGFGSEVVERIGIDGAVDDEGLGVNEAFQPHSHSVVLLLNREASPPKVGT